jgi:hypothetical protein
MFLHARKLLYVGSYSHHHRSRLLSIGVAIWHQRQSHSAMVKYGLGLPLSQEGGFLAEDESPHFMLPYVNDVPYPSTFKARAPSTCTPSYWQARRAQPRCARMCASSLRTQVLGIAWRFSRRHDTVMYGRGLLQQ